MKSLCAALLSNSSFLSLLAEVDKLEGERMKGARCSECQEGVLHCAYYPRMPRGLKFPLFLSNTRRISFCCSKCRKRTTPPSLQFCGRKVYSSLIVILSLLLRSTRDPRHTLLSIRGVLGVSEKTIQRWRELVVTFLATAEWAALRLTLSPIFSTEHFPSSLMAEFKVKNSDETEAVRRMMHFLSPSLIH